LSSGWKKEKLLQLQLQLGGENYLQDLLNQKEETHLKRCFSCKKGTLMTVVLFDKRGPLKNWKRKYQQAVKSRS
jgi:hypothetical protein